MKPHDAMVRGRLDSEAKAKAGVVLARMGLSMSAAIRLFLAFIAEEQRLPEGLEASWKTGRDFAGRPGEKRKGTRNSRKGQKVFEGLDL